MDGPGALRGPQMGDVALQSMEMVESMHPLCSVASDSTVTPVVLASSAAAWV